MDYTSKDIHSPEEIKKQIEVMRTYFDEGHTLSLDLRKKLLISLEEEIQKNTEEICKAVFCDFHKPRGEMYLTEIFTVIGDLKHTIRNINKWARPQRVNTNLALLPSHSKIYKSPKGIVLSISPWNYSFYLAMLPLIAAIAAGNVVVLKPAHETPQLSMLIKKIVEKVFDKRHVFVILGEGKSMGELLLNNFEFNHIFFTGSPRVGSWIMEKAAKYLTPVTLELGGKSPSIIHKEFDHDYAAKKIVWGKFINAGQTCVCTDYVLVHENNKQQFIDCCIKYIKLFFGDDVFQSKEYSHIINEQRFDTITSYLKEGNIVFGGKHDRKTLCIEPTILLLHNLDNAMMKDEIFGPILPIVTYKDEKEIIDIVRRNRYPLSMYVFSSNYHFTKRMIEKIEFGGGCVNNTVYQIGNTHLPFGGIQYSGMGHYHGEVGFNTFSNLKSMLHNAKWFDLPLFYQPYTSNKLSILKKFFR
ncbi:MAG: hypothetical protein RLZZ546_1951 [Bacteroidota bacterium]